MVLSFFLHGSYYNIINYIFGLSTMLQDSEAVERTGYVPIFNHPKS
jgi:hypothetical protein